MSIRNPKNKHKERYGRDDLRPTEVGITRDENDVEIARSYEPVDFPGLTPRPNWQAGKAGKILSWVTNSLPDDPGLVYPLGELRTDKPKATAQSNIKHYTHNNWIRDFEAKRAEEELSAIEISDDEEPGWTMFNLAPGYLGREITSTTMALARHQENRESLELEVSEQGKRYVKAKTREEKIAEYAKKYTPVEPEKPKRASELVEPKLMATMVNGPIRLNNLALKRLDKLGRPLKPADVLAALGF